MESEALNENIGRWETTWFTFIYCILSVLIWWGTTPITYAPLGGTGPAARRHLRDIHLWETGGFFYGSVILGGSGSCW